MRAVRAFLLLTPPLALLSACGLGSQELRGTAYLAISIEGDQPLTKGILQEEVLQAQTIVAAFRKLHPHVAIETNLFRESYFIAEVRRRQAAGLAPDLMLLPGSTARTLVEADLAQGLSLPDVTRHQLDPDSLARLEITPGTLAGLPILRRPPLACYNRSQVSASPATTVALIDQARQGLRVGLAVQSRSLFWSTGPLGADRALIAAAAGRRLGARERQGLQRWLEWLSAANFRARPGGAGAGSAGTTPGLDPLQQRQPRQAARGPGASPRGERPPQRPLRTAHTDHDHAAAGAGLRQRLHGRAAARGGSPGRLCAQPLDPEHPDDGQPGHAAHPSLRAPLGPAQPRAEGDAAVG